MVCQLRRDEDTDERVGKFLSNFFKILFSVLIKYINELWLLCKSTRVHAHVWSYLVVDYQTSATPVLLKLCKQTWQANKCYFQVNNKKNYIFELQRKIWGHDWSSQLCTQLKQLWNTSLKKKESLIISLHLSVLVWLWSFIYFLVSLSCTGILWTHKVTSSQLAL